MTYAAGQTILDDEYNIFAWGNANGTINNTNDNVNTVLGTGLAGTSSRGYGNATVAGVAAGTTISATQWATLVNKVASIASHQATTITAITAPVGGNTIAAFTAMAANITAITTNRRNAAANGTSIVSTATTTGTWNASATRDDTITFSSAAHQRFFFNAGGRILLNANRSGGTAETKNTAWSTLLTACGVIHLSGSSTSKTIAGVAYTGTTKIGGSGTPATLLTATGVEDYLSVSFTEIFRQNSATSPYGSNYVSLRTKQLSTNVIQLQWALLDLANANTDESVDGTLNIVYTVVPPSTTYLTSSWGTPVISNVGLSIS